MRRYDSDDGVDGLPPGEGVFLPCSFWLADNLRLIGRTDEAPRPVRAPARLVNDVGLLAEEYDPASGRMLGNFPQAFTHVSLVNTAGNLSSATRPALHRVDRRGRARRQPGMTPVRMAAATSRSSRRRATIQPRYTATCMTTSWSSS